MESVYNAPNGDTFHVNDTIVVAQSLGRILELFGEDSEPVFFADGADRPEGVVISFRAWAEYEIERQDADEELRRLEVVRRLEARDPSRKVSFEEAAREGGWDPDVPPGPPNVAADHARRAQALLDAVIMDGQYPLPDGRTLPVIDIGTAGESLSQVLEQLRDGHAEPVLVAGDQARPEAVVISFDQWADYEAIKEEAEFERWVYDITRERLANSDPSKWVTFEEMMAEYGLDPDAPELTPNSEGGNDESGTS